MSEIVYFKRGEQVEAANVKSQLFNRLSRDGEWTRVEVENEEPQQAEAVVEVVIQEQAPEEASQAPEAQPQVTEAVVKSRRRARSNYGTQSEYGGINSTCAQHDRRQR